MVTLLVFLTFFSLGLVVTIYSWFACVKRAFGVHVGWGAATICAPFGQIVFMATNWYAGREFAFSWFLGRGLLVLAFVFGYLGSLGERYAPHPAQAQAQAQTERPLAGTAPAAPTNDPTRTETTSTPRRVEGSVGSTTTHEGSLILTASVRGAPIDLDARRIGVAPVTLDAVAPGAHTVSSTVPGFEPFSQTFTLAPSDVVSVTIRLDPKGPGEPGSHGFLTLEDATPGREVRVFGDLVGRTPLADVPVPSGIYAITLVAPDGAAVTMPLAVPPQETTRLTATPAPAAETSARRRAR